MDQPNKQQQDVVSLSGGNLALRDATLVADDLILDTSTLSAKVHPNAQESKPSSYTVALFCDEALVTRTELLYGEAAYPLENIDSLQILKLERRRSVIRKKLSNFVAGIIATIGAVLLLSSLAWPIRCLGLLLASCSIGYAVYFNWWIEQRGRGEFGLVLTTKAASTVVITSHSLKAVQSLYQVIFRRLDTVNSSDEPLMINMYTGAIIDRS